VADRMPAAVTPPRGHAIIGRARLGRAYLPDRRRLGLVVASSAALALALVSWLRFLWGAFHAPVGQYDLSSYYAAALALRHSLHANTYSSAVLAHAGAVGAVQVQPPLPYTYPPLLAIALIPLTVLPFHIAARAWMLLNAALWLGSMLQLAIELRSLVRPTSPADQKAARSAPSFWARTLADPSGLTALAASALLCLPFAPAQQTVLLGQIDLLVLFPLACVPWLTRHGHERWVGAAIALVAMLKLTPVLLLGYLALRRRWEALRTSVAVLAALSLVSMVVVGPGVFFSALPEALRVGSGDATLGHNEALLAPIVAVVAGAAAGLAGVARAAEYAGLAALGLAVAWVLWRSARPGAFTSSFDESASPHDAGEASSREAAAYAVALCAMLLLSPATWVHHYVWTLPAVALALGLTARRAMQTSGPGGSARAWGLCALVVIAALLLRPNLPYSWDTQPHPAQDLLFGLPLRPALLEMRAVGTLLVLVVAAMLLRCGPAAKTQGGALGS
jgi:Glycosyltransferase family 87